MQKKSLNLLKVTGNLGFPASATASTHNFSGRISNFNKTKLSYAENTDVKQFLTQIHQEKEERLKKLEAIRQKKREEEAAKRQEAEEATRKLSEEAKDRKLKHFEEFSHLVSFKIYIRSWLFSCIH